MANDRKDKKMFWQGNRSVYDYVFRSVPPAVTDDISKGFVPGSKWFSTTASYVCISNAKGAALWGFTAGSNVPAATALAAGFQPIVSGHGYLIQVLEKVIVPTGVSTDLPVDIPAASVVLCGSMNIDSAISAVGNSAKLGLGPVAAPGKYGVCAALTKNTKGQIVPPLALLAAAEDVQLNALQADGATIATGALVTGSCRVRLVIRTFAPIPNAP